MPANCSAACARCRPSPTRTLARGRFAAAVERAFEAAKSATGARAVLTAIAIFLVFGSVVLVLWVGAQDVIAGDITPGRLSQFVLYAVFAASGLGQLSEVWGELSQASGAAERLFEIMNVKPRDQAAGAAGPAAGAGARRDRLRQRALRLSDAAGDPGARRRVVARAAGREGRDRRPVGRRQEHDLPPDPALLRSGCPAPSASTACRSPTPIRCALRRHIALVPQDTVIFAASIADNIRFGRPEASDADVSARGRACAGLRIHQPPAAGFRHAGRRARRHALGRPAPAHRHRARDPARRAAAPARRGDVLARRRERDAGAGRARTADGASAPRSSSRTGSRPCSPATASW